MIVNVINSWGLCTVRFKLLTHKLRYTMIDEEMAGAMAQNLVGRRVTPSEQEVNFGKWHISYKVSRILPSICSTKVVCEKDDDQFCQFCIYSQSLTLPHLPDMVFPNNILKLTHNSGLVLSFSPLEALKSVGHTQHPIKVACAEEWKESRPDAEDTPVKFDWTFTCDYKGDLTGNYTVEKTDEQIDREILKKKDKIIFYNDLTLYEDELHDHGVSMSSVKIRVMPNYWYILLRFFLRVDNVLFRTFETRYFHDAKTDYILREFTAREAKADSLDGAVHLMGRYPDEVIPMLPLHQNIMEKIILLDVADK